MSEDRTVGMGCSTVFFVCILISALWGIASELRGIKQQLVIQRCFEMAKAGARCAEIGPENKQ